MEKELDVLRTNNPTIEISEFEDYYKVEKPWNDTSVMFLFPKSFDFEGFENLIFPEELVAIQHIDTSILEIIWGPVPNTEKVLTRNFNFSYRGHDFKCYFNNASKSLEKLASAFYQADYESFSDYRNLDIIQQFLEPESSLHDVLDDDIGLFSFFVEGPFNKDEIDCVELCKYLNFYMNYFDRQTPWIVILKKNKSETSIKVPNLIDVFPTHIQSQEIDPILLDIFLTAKEVKSHRLRFIFYFQIIEYCSYYYLSDRLQKKLTKLLKDPTIVTNADLIVKRLIEDLKDNFSSNDDKTKIEKTVLENCSIEDLKKEIKGNWEYFTQHIKFDGGLELMPIIKDEEHIDKLVDTDLIKIKNNIQTIRNVLVHLRESRENKVIYPTEKNDHLIKPYLYLAERIAECVTIRYS